MVHRLDEGSLANDHIIADANDDVAIPLSAVIQDALGFNIANIPAKVDTGTTHCVDSMEKLNDSLMAAGDYKDIWAFINFDECM